MKKVIGGILLSISLSNIFYSTIVPSLFIHNGQPQQRQYSHYFLTYGTSLNCGLICHSFMIPFLSEGLYTHSSRCILQVEFKSPRQWCVLSDILSNGSTINSVLTLELESGINVSEKNTSVRKDNVGVSPYLYYINLEFLM